MVGCRWVFAIKVGPHGQIDRLKARLVAKRNTQIFGLDYGDLSCGKDDLCSSFSCYGNFANGLFINWVLDVRILIGMVVPQTEARVLVIVFCLWSSNFLEK